MPASLLDTDILSELLKQKNPTVVQNAAAALAMDGAFAFSALTRYEMVRGLKAKRAFEQLHRFETFCQQSLVLPVTDAVFNRAADLWVLGRKGGHPHADADLLIAATALEYERTLVTGNTSHFAWIPGITLADWRSG